MHPSIIHFSLLWVIIWISVKYGYAATATGEGLELIILHNNDIHGRFEETGPNSIECAAPEGTTRDCYGGFARTAHVIRQYREKAKQPGGTPVLFLNAGDSYSGTTWFSVFRENITTAFLNALKPDAVSLGNHEFDEGIEGLIPFLENTNFPILAANLDLHKTPELAATKSILNSIVLTISGTKVGIVGYLTPETKFLNRKNDVEYYGEIEKINEEAELLKSQGVNIIIALGHSGFVTDQKIAKSCPDVDIVVGGHTNTFLYTGIPPNMEIPEGPYPVVIKQDSGKQVPVVQAYAFTKYLGYIKLKFDPSGNLKSWEGNPILLDSSIPEDSDILAMLELYRPNITAIQTEVLGESRVILDASKPSCRKKECNMGNLIADAMVFARIKELEKTAYKYWTDASIALVQAGGLRSSIERKPDSKINRNDILSVLPFANGLFVVKVPGRVIRSTLEYSATKYHLMQSTGAFLQISGIRVVYDMTKSLGSRVLHVQTLCADCEIPKYEDLNDEKIYKMILTSFLVFGGDGHRITDINNPMKDAIDMDITDTDAIAAYIKAKAPINPAVEDRIVIRCGQKCY